MAAVGIMYVTTQKELAPEEDQGILFNIVKVPQTANLDYLEQATGELNKVFETVPEKEHVFIINGMGDDVRHGDRRHPVQAVGGAQAHAEADPAEPAAEGRRHRRRAGDLLPAAVAAGLDRRRPPVQFVITTTADYQQLAQVLAELQAEAHKSGLFIFTDRT